MESWVPPRYDDYIFSVPLCGEFESNDPIYSIHEYFSRGIKPAEDLTSQESRYAAP